MSNEFKRENRYIVIKRKHLENLPWSIQIPLKPALEEADKLLPKLECLVIESDWPEYEPTWAKIEARMTGAAPQPLAVGGEPEDLVREVFLRNGFKIKEGQTDLKPYVYAAAKELTAPLRAEIDQLKARLDELEHRAADVVEGFDGEQLPGAMTMRIRKLKAALSKPAGGEKV